MNKDNFVFFWGGPFSQWFKQDFELNGRTYATAEQYMMAQKAVLFGDMEVYEEIMATKDPREQKALGRKVRGFNPDKWNMVCRKVVYEANLAKFSSPKMKKILMETGNKELVEASPYDTIWGIGLGEDDPRCLDRSQWRGTNWLGEALMEVRDTLRS